MKFGNLLVVLAVALVGCGPEEKTSLPAPKAPATTTTPELAEKAMAKDEDPTSAPSGKDIEPVVTSSEPSALKLDKADKLEGLKAHAKAFELLWVEIVSIGDKVAKGEIKIKPDPDLPMPKDLLDSQAEMFVKGIKLYEDDESDVELRIIHVFNLADDEIGQILKVKEPEGDLPDVDDHKAWAPIEAAQWELLLKALWKRIPAKKRRGLIRPTGAELHKFWREYQDSLGPPEDAPE